MKNNKNGFTLVELLVVIGILGILMGALFPAISSAMLSANTNAMAMRGRNLFVAITQANTDREAAGLQSVWPSDNTEGLDTDEQALIGASSAKDYFEELFDIKNKGNAANWKPYIDVDIGVLSGGGVAGMSGTTLQAENVAWYVTKNVQSETADVIPVLASRNVDDATLSSTIGGSIQGNESTEINCGTSGGGKYDTPFGNKAWVLVRKGGASQVVKAKYSKISVVFSRQGFDNSQAEYKPTLLTLK